MEMMFIYLTALLIPLKTPKMEKPTSLNFLNVLRPDEKNARRIPGCTPVSEEQEQEPQRLGLGRQFHEHQQSMVSYRTDGETMISNL